MSPSSSTLTSKGRPLAERTARKRTGNTNGLSRGGRRAGGHLRLRSTASSLFLLVGVIFYALSLVWPLGSLSPSWLAYALAFIGIGMILASLKNVWASAKTFPRRT